MKHLIITSIILFFVVTLHAQKVTKGSFNVLANEKMVSVSIDYSDAKIAKIPFDIFLETEENWNEGYSEIMNKFVIGANKKSKGLKYLKNKPANYQLIIKVVKVDDDGETRGSLILLDDKNNIIGEAEKFHARGGRFGSQMNLMGDAAERLGKKVAQFINYRVNLNK